MSRVASFELCGLFIVPAVFFASRFIETLCDSDIVPRGHSVLANGLIASAEELPEPHVQPQHLQACVDCHVVPFYTGTYVTLTIGLEDFTCRDCLSRSAKFYIDWALTEDCEINGHSNIFEVADFRNLSGSEHHLDVHIAPLSAVSVTVTAELNRTNRDAEFHYSHWARTYSYQATRTVSSGGADLTISVHTVAKMRDLSCQFDAGTMCSGWKAVTKPSAQNLSQSLRTWTSRTTPFNFQLGNNSDSYFYVPDRSPSDNPDSDAATAATYVRQAENDAELDRIRGIVTSLRSPVYVPDRPFQSGTLKVTFWLYFSAGELPVASWAYPVMHVRAILQDYHEPAGGFATLTAAKEQDKLFQNFTAVIHGTPVSSFYPPLSESASWKWIETVAFFCTSGGLELSFDVTHKVVGSVVALDDIVTELVNSEDCTERWLLSGNNVQNRVGTISCSFDDADVSHSNHYSSCGWVGVSLSEIVEHMELDKLEWSYGVSNVFSGITVRPPDSENTVLGTILSMQNYVTFFTSATTAPDSKAMTFEFSYIFRYAHNGSAASARLEVLLRHLVPSSTAYYSTPLLAITLSTQMLAWNTLAARIPAFAARNENLMFDIRMSLVAVPDSEAVVVLALDDFKYHAESPKENYPVKRSGQTVLNHTCDIGKGLCHGWMLESCGEGEICVAKGCEPILQPDKPTCFIEPHPTIDSQGSPQSNRTYGLPPYVWRLTSNAYTAPKGTGLARLSFVVLANVTFDLSVFLDTETSHQKIVLDVLDEPYESAASTFEFDDMRPDLDNYTAAASQEASASSLPRWKGYVGQYCVDSRSRLVWEFGLETVGLASWFRVMEVTTEIIPDVDYLPGGTCPYMLDGGNGFSASIPQAACRNVMFCGHNGTSGSHEEERSMTVTIALTTTASIICLSLTILLGIKMRTNQLKQVKLQRRTALTKVLPKELLDQYELNRNRLKLGDVVGTGNAGYVFAGTLNNMPDNGQLAVAVKIPRLPSASRAEEVASEIRLLVKLNGRHRNVVRLLGLVVSYDISMILEFCELGSMYDILRRSRSPLSSDSTDSCTAAGIETISDNGNSRGAVVLETGVLTTLAFETADGMNFLASEGVVHGDLAARNLLLDQSLTVKISDFGMAQDCSGSKHPEKKCGLPVRWMAPERYPASKGNTLDSSSDVWSFGVILWELFTFAEVPNGTAFPDQLGVAGSKRLLRYLKEGNRLYPPPLCPPTLVDLMRRCWSLQASERPAFEELKNQLREHLPRESRGNYVDWK